MTCDGCQFWSERIAWSDGDRTLAACLIGGKDPAKGVWAGCDLRSEGPPIDAFSEDEFDES